MASVGLTKKVTDGKGDPVEAEGQWAGWHSQLLRAKLSVCRNELCSTGLEQTDQMSQTPTTLQMVPLLTPFRRSFPYLTDVRHILNES